ncbi:MAG TPA: hypothetical protein VH325_03580 [Bryobacteraceae bacterium]|jgi:hypothetical protein|nr:hypothetical protein [Bryobacteraceae bacterium]
MTRRTVLTALPLSLAGITLMGDDQENGPRPPKKDIPFIKHADHLVETESQNAAQSKSKGGLVFSVPGATSTARTPLPEPIFLFVQDKIRADQLQLFHFTVQNGMRQVLAKQKDDDDDKVYHISLRQLQGDLYRLDASESLDPGEYCLSPVGLNLAFCFTVF